ncbi:MAG: ECF transporter S component [Candidatus Bathyarchaeia archaeon]
MRDPHKTPLQLAVGSLFAALVFVVTYSFPIFIPATGGYFNFGETIIYVAALTFGPVAGGLCGGVGAMIADALLAPQFAAGTLVIKLVEGAVVGSLSRRLSKRLSRLAVAASVSVVVGGLWMVAGYFVYEQLVLGYPLAAALVEVPANLAQMAISLVIAVPIVHVVFRMFPQLKS